MFRFRRYRVYLACAAVILVLLYQVSKNSQWDPTLSSLPDYLQTHSNPNSQADKADSYGNGTPDEYAQKSKPWADDAEQKAPEPEPKKAQTVKIPELKTLGENVGGYALPTPTNVASPPAVEEAETTEKAALSTPPAIVVETSVPTSTAPDAEDETLHIQKPPGADRTQSVAPPAATPTQVHWTKLTEWFPVPEEKIIPLPTGTPKKIPAVQYKFKEETPEAKEKRESRLAKVKAEAERAWGGYKKYAWMHDEVQPVSKRPRDPFCGWAATLVDSLDTLWIMGLEDEFDVAAKAVKDIDFTYTPYRDDIPVFETIIRYLGGFLAAYDVSGGHAGKYRILLDKAVELAEILMGVFDTPNRMPILYYNWKPAFASNPKRASTSSGVAELGSLQMEFTRLAQLTRENRYYDAAARVTDALEDLQKRGTALDGIFPAVLDASGCNRALTNERQQQALSDEAKKQTKKAPLPGDDSAVGYKSNTTEPKTDSPKEDGKTETVQKRGVPYNEKTKGLASDDDVAGLDGMKATSSPFIDPGEHPALDTLEAKSKEDGPLTAKGLPENWDCVEQGLVPGGWGASSSFSMGGSQDSAYEYFPKQYLLLGGLEPKYRAMHEKVVKAVKKYLLFRPMIEGDRDILFSARVLTKDETDKDLTYEYEVSHLTCFLGGMFGLGGKIFESEEDVEIGKKLADGCAWAYEVMPSGIMPEYAAIVPCKDPKNCSFNQTMWYQTLDPSHAWRDEQAAKYEETYKAWQTEAKKVQEEIARRNKAKEAAKEAAAEFRPGNKTEPATGAAEAGSDPSLRRRTWTPTDEVVPAKEGISELVKDKVTEPEGSIQGKSADDKSTLSDPDPVLPVEPVKPQSHKEYVEEYIKERGIPPGYSVLHDKRYIMRPEAIESVWYMYRITGDITWQEKGWKMFESIIKASQVEAGHSAVGDVTLKENFPHEDSMESFWLAETLKYFYLLFATPDVISLDEWVLNTEAHPFKRPTGPMA